MKPLIDHKMTTEGTYYDNNIRKYLNRRGEVRDAGAFRRLKNGLEQLTDPGILDIKKVLPFLWRDVPELSPHDYGKFIETLKRSGGIFNSYDVERGESQMIVMHRLPSDPIKDM